jgi:hypothetical protein
VYSGSLPPAASCGRLYVMLADAGSALGKPQRPPPTACRLLAANTRPYDLKFTE